MRRKWIAALVLAVIAVAAAAALSACRPSSSAVVEPSAEEPSIPTLRLLTIGESDAAAAERVSEALSELTRERLGCNVEIVMLHPKDYDDLIDNLVLNSDLADILVCTEREKLEELIDGNYVYSLDRYLDRYPEFRACVPDEEAWLQTQMDGHCYGIPFGNESAFAPGFLMRSDICRELGVSADDITDLEQLEQLLLQVKANYPELTPVVPHYGHMENFISYDPRAKGVVGAAGDGEYQSIADLDGFAQLCAAMYSWHEQGLILRDATFSDDSRAAWIGDGLAFGSFARLNAYTERQTEYAMGMELECVFFGDMLDAGDALANSFCIYAYTQDVELSLSLLRLIYTDPQVRQLCVYGQEGIDCEYAADGAVIPGDTEPEGGRYTGWYWPLLDQVSPPWRAEGPALDIPEDGFSRPFWPLDQSAVSVEVYQCGKVLDKYFDALCAGLLEPEEGVARMRQELSEAGIGTVVDEVNRQWLALTEE